MAEQTLNIPQTLVFLAITILVLRWFLKPSAAASPATRAASVNPAQIDNIAQMFPQLDRRTIAWNLGRNGGNAQAVVEAMIAGRALEQPPPSFQLAVPASTAQRQPASRTPAKPTQPDLITRYNLSSKVGEAAQTTPEKQPTAKAWSQDKNERQANLQRRRDEMVLAARRKLEEKARAEAKIS